MPLLTKLKRAALPFLFLLAACVPSPKIKDIVEHPRNYAGKQVQVTGEVKSVFSLVFVKYFSIDDGTGVITVVTQKPLPAKGERLTVKGKVEEGFSLGDQTMTLIVEEQEGGVQSVHN
jgi:aspartyl/asparaginyl-tRNA synthetase